VSAPLQPLNNTEVYLAAVLEVLFEIKSELRQLNQSATQKQPIQVQLDAMRLSEANDQAHEKRNQSKLVRK
jgi:hypothetical protein